MTIKHLSAGAEETSRLEEEKKKEKDEEYNESQELESMLYV